MAEGKRQIREGFDSIHPISTSPTSIHIDMLHRFCPGNKFSKNMGYPETEELELSLGLSLNGRFGVDAQKSKSNNLPRSSSISNFLSKGEIPQSVEISRAVSLPAGTEEEWRKRKGMQLIRRMEAKRKRTEKQMASPMGRDYGGEDGNVINQEPQAQFYGEVLKGSILNKNGVENGQSVQHPPGSSPGSAVSQASGSGSSSLVSDFDSQIVAGISKTVEAKSPPTVPSFPSQKPPKGASKETSPKPANVGEEMPYVSTTGEGPNGKRIEGFLYPFKKGEDVRIVCVCHGNFLSPAEFVRHAGGGEVDHPLRRIVVNATANSFL